MKLYTFVENAQKTQKKFTGQEATPTPAATGEKKLHFTGSKEHKSRKRNFQKKKIYVEQILRGTTGVKIDFKKVNSLLMKALFTKS